jgi:hypothetical protein
MTAWSCERHDQPSKKREVPSISTPTSWQALADYAARRDQSRSLIAEAAIASFLSPDDAERREAVVAKRLDQIDRRMTRLERDVGIAVETLAVFIRFWLTTTPALAEPAAQAARAKVGRALRGVHHRARPAPRQGPKLRQEIPEDVGESPRTEP